MTSAACCCIVPFRIVFAIGMAFCVYDVQNTAESSNMLPQHTGTCKSGSRRKRESARLSHMFTTNPHSLLHTSTPPPPPPFTPNPHTHLSPRSWISMGQRSKNWNAHGWTGRGMSGQLHGRQLSWQRDGSGNMQQTSSVRTDTGPARCPARNPLAGTGR